MYFEESKYRSRWFSRWLEVANYGLSLLLTEFDFELLGEIGVKPS